MVSKVGGRRGDLQASRELQPGVHAPRASAKRAVDYDPAQSALEEGELLIIELGDEQLRDPAGVDRRGFGEAGNARLGEGNDHATAVGTRFVSTDEALIDQ